MNAAPDRPVAAPVVIVGGGLAGLFCALKLAPRPVLVLAAAPIGEGASSAWAQGGIAAAMAEGDTFEKHLADTVAAGAGIVDEAIARGMIEEGPERVRDLLSYGVPFDRDLEGRLSLSREAAHSERRIVRVRGDMAGRAIMEALVAKVRETSSIVVRENAVALDLLVGENGVTGVRFVEDGAVREVCSSTTVLASGGVGHLFAVTTNPVEASGRGLGMAARAGAKIADAEFVQFHPTAIDIGADPAPLATEALRGEGATLVDREGRRFMPAHHPDAELAPRDIVARAIFTQVASGEGAFLDCRGSVGAAFPERFPTVYASCIAAGIDPVTEPVPVIPAVHYHMGGVLTDADGRTSLPGLWACGEVASTGVHGANRLASNSLLEAVVFAARVAADIEGQESAPAQSTAAPQPRALPAGDASTLERLRKIMSRSVGVVRSGETLRRALREIEELRQEDTGHAYANELAACLIIAASALSRMESRGAHFRSDWPQTGTTGERTVCSLAEAEATASGLHRDSAPKEGPCALSLLHLPELPPVIIAEAVRTALAEDLGRVGDITSFATIPRGRTARAVLAARREGVLCGLPLAREAFRQMDAGLRFEAGLSDGHRLSPGETIATIEGDARAILTAERTALNFLMHLSGVASLTARFAAEIAHTQAKIVCTRKTIPGLRSLEKYAVRCGGGANHRFGLDDAMLIKDNHIAVAGGVTAALTAAKAYAGHLVAVEIEVDTLDQLAEAIQAGADAVLLDNMAPDELARAVAITASRARLEASGNVDLGTVAAIAETGVDLISTSKITMSAPALDIGLDIVVA